MKYYVYEHWRTDTDLCFYVGKGCGNRAYSMTKRWTNHKAVQKYLSDNGFAIEVRMVQTGLLRQCFASSASGRKSDEAPEPASQRPGRSRDALRL